MKTASKTTILFVSAALLFTTACSTAHKPGSITVKSNASPELYNEIAHMDSVMFNAFNTHDLDKLKATFSEDVEFYNDGGELTTYQQTIENFRAMFERNQQSGLRRELVPGSLEVYPLKNYGAIEVGIHRFHHTENGKEETGTLKFVQIWQKKDGQWKATRVISYGH